METVRAKLHMIMTESYLMAKHQYHVVASTCHKRRRIKGGEVYRYKS